MKIKHWSSGQFSHLRNCLHGCLGFHYYSAIKFGGRTPLLDKFPGAVHHTALNSVFVFHVPATTVTFRQTRIGLIQYYCLFLPGDSLVFHHGADHCSSELWNYFFGPSTSSGIHLSSLGAKNSWLIIKQPQPIIICICAHLCLTAGVRTIKKTFVLSEAAISIQNGSNTTKNQEQE